ncbi:hypothetical protein [Polyangium sorediatum]|uniref:Uncharacterized protein n=1 Tax=Polyangium sorediatum TaxID=889274 RepID=A0ABT6NWL7_9BACT|nr:hypothetical protein [Polyangium sorediatum]MDI1432734.1 hypothetical protein [Polyangium sorediatum]
MGQAFGCINADGSIDSGSGNFRVVKKAPGQYFFTVDGESSSDPVVVVTPGSAYMTANAIITATNGGNAPNFTISTGYTDQGSTKTMDVDWFCFVAFWS